MAAISRKARVEHVPAVSERYHASSKLVGSSMNGGSAPKPPVMRSCA